MVMVLVYESQTKPRNIHRDGGKLTIWVWWDCMLRFVSFFVSRGFRIERESGKEGSRRRRTIIVHKVFYIVLLRLLPFLICSIWSRFFVACVCISLSLSLLLLSMHLYTCRALLFVTPCLLSAVLYLLFLWCVAILLWSFLLVDLKILVPFFCGLPGRSFSRPFLPACMVVCLFGLNYLSSKDFSFHINSLSVFSSLYSNLLRSSPP